MKTLKRRRKENKTDYARRINLLKGESPRVVFRKTNRYIIAQYVTSKAAQDKIELSVTSKSLLEHGWPKDFEGSLKSIPASYLTGFLLGKRISMEEMDTPILDTGMIKNLHKSKVFGFLKGLKDAGVEVKCDEEFFPDDETIMGKHLKKDFSKAFEGIKSSIEKKK